MRRVGSLSRTAALVALGSFAVHQLRFLIALFGGGDEIARQGHSYLGHVAPTLAAVAFAVIAARLWTAYTGAARPHAGVSGSGLQRSVTFGVAILSVYVAQELLESALFSAHPQGVEGVLEGGGWLAVALALCFGPLCFLLDVGLSRLEVRVARSTPSEVVAAAPPLTCSVAFLLRVPSALSPLAFGIARRPPPLPR